MTQTPLHQFSPDLNSDRQPTEGELVKRARLGAVESGVWFLIAAEESIKRQTSAIDMSGAFVGRAAVGYESVTQPVVPVQSADPMEHIINNANAQALSAQETLDAIQKTDR